MYMFLCFIYSNMFHIFLALIFLIKRQSVMRFLVRAHSSSSPKRYFKKVASITLRTGSAHKDNKKGKSERSFTKNCKRRYRPTRPKGLMFTGHK